MRREPFALGVLLLFLAAPARGQTPWERYLELPTPANARAVQTLAYSDSADNVDRLLDDLQLLEDQMAAGDSDAVRLALRLAPHADGAYGETLATMLGRLVRIHPTLFLRELRATGEGPTRARSGLLSGCSVVSVTAPEYVDRARARAYEGRQRIAALMTATDPRLRTLRDECVAQLKADVRSDDAAP